MTKTNRTMSGIGLSKESHLANSGANAGHPDTLLPSERVICEKCKKKLPTGDMGIKDKFGNRFCGWRCFKSFHGIPEIHD